MGRIVKCKDNGEKIYSDNAFQTVRFTSGGKKVVENWSSKEAYEIYRKNLEYKDKINNKVKELLDYKSNLPTTFYIGLEEFKPYGYETVYEYICQNAESFTWAHSYWTDTQPKLMRYCLGIIRNGIQPFYKKKIEYMKAAEKQQNDQSLDNELVVENRTLKTKNISRFLEG